MKWEASAFRREEQSLQQAGLFVRYGARPRFVRCWRRPAGRGNGVALLRIELRELFRQIVHALQAAFARAGIADGSDEVVRRASATPTPIR